MSFKVIFTNADFPITELYKLYWVGNGKQHCFKTMFLPFKILTVHSTALGTKEILCLSVATLIVYFAPLFCKFRQLCCVEWEVEYFPGTCFDFPYSLNQDIMHDFIKIMIWREDSLCLNFVLSPPFREERGWNVLNCLDISCAHIFIPHIIWDHLKRECLEKRGKLIQVESKMLAS